MARKHVEGILNLYWFPPDGFAPAMMEHVESFERYLEHPVYAWNTAYGLPDWLREYDFAAVTLHYSLFGGPIHWIDDAWCEYISSMKDAFKVAFFQDEYRFWGLRYELLDSLPIDLVYTLFEPRWHEATYHKRGWAGKAVYALTGYVGDDMVRMAETHAVSGRLRSVDIGYRARNLEEYMGRGATEKSRIAEQFLALAENSELRLDISTREEDRIYGEDWYAFLGDCNGCIGVEAGVSVVDTEDVLWPVWRRMKDENPDMDFETFSETVGLDRWEEVITYRMLSPRHFECAALGVCQILFEGAYSDVMQPGVHYLELKKDFSNLPQVIEAFSDAETRNTIIRRAKKDLIESGAYHYRNFMAEFRQELKAASVRLATERDTGLDALFAKGEEDGYARYETQGEWFGPHLHPRPNWPKNVAHLKQARLAVSASGELVVE